MLWQYLGNGDHGEAPRRCLADVEWPVFENEGKDIFRAPPLLTADEEFQRQRFHSVIAGPWMGTDSRRGFPYTRILNHLGDSDGMVSPRSFIVALRTAAIDTADRHPDHAFPLHYDSMERGVREASKIRVLEHREEYPWVNRLLAPLSAMVVPGRFEGIERIWNNKDILDRLSDQIGQDYVKLPPRSINRGSVGVRENLDALGVFRRLKDNRVDIPDVFRSGYGLGRKCGAKPVT